jgi:hypothetical protein
MKVDVRVPFAAVYCSCHDVCGKVVWSDFEQRNFVSVRQRRLGSLLIDVMMFLGGCCLMSSVLGGNCHLLLSRFRPHPRQKLHHLMRGGDIDRGCAHIHRQN